eukprot:1705085-Alexandrium_andersonii.AAC.1
MAARTIPCQPIALHHNTLQCTCQTPHITTQYSTMHDITWHCIHYLQCHPWSQAEDVRCSLAGKRPRSSNEGGGGQASVALAELKP